MGANDFDLSGWNDLRYNAAPCTQHSHPDPVPCIACCYTDNGYCQCECHQPHKQKRK